LTDENVTALSFLVVRIGKVYDIKKKAYIKEDPIAEVDQVLSLNDSCFFAKFGKKLNAQRISDLCSKKGLRLVIVINVDGLYVSKTYILKQACNELDSKHRNYPAYYAGKEAFIGTWLEISKSDFQAPIGALVVTSSYKKLVVSMSTSMSSFFFCKL
jgi:hypothetical protein